MIITCIFWDAVGRLENIDLGFRDTLSEVCCLFFLDFLTWPCLLLFFDFLFRPFLPFPFLRDVTVSLSLDEADDADCGREAGSDDLTADLAAGCD